MLADKISPYAFHDPDSFGDVCYLSDGTRVEGRISGTAANPRGVELSWQWRIKLGQRSFPCWASPEEAAEARRAEVYGPINFARMVKYYIDLIDRYVIGLERKTSYTREEIDGYWSTYEKLRSDWSRDRGRASRDGRCVYGSGAFAVDEPCRVGGVDQIDRVMTAFSEFKHLIERYEKEIFPVYVEDVGGETIMGLSTSTFALLGFGGVALLVLLRR